MVKVVGIHSKKQKIKAQTLMEPEMRSIAACASKRGNSFNWI
jgi:hypothetical protein